MTPRRAPASGYYYSDPYRENVDSWGGDSELFFEYGIEGGNSSVSTPRWGGISVAHTDAPQFISPFYPSGYNPWALSPMTVPTVSPDSGVRVAVPPAEIRQLPVRTDMLLSEPPQRWPQIQPRVAEQAVVLPYPERPVDRTVQIAGFSWTLPSDPGEGGPYPSLTFLIGAAISSGASGTMQWEGIHQWIRERYPSWPQSASNSIDNALVKQADFTFIRTGVRNRGVWKLSNPQQFRDYYEKDIFLKRQHGAGLRDRTFRNPLPASEQGRPEPISLARSVKIGGYILTLPPCSAGQLKLPLRLLCGCAIAFGPEQGMSVREITEWIAHHYSIQGANAMERLSADTRSTLNIHCNDFQRTNICIPKMSRQGPARIRWVLKKPADFAAYYAASAWGYCFTLLPSSPVGTAAPLADVRQVSASESAPLAESPQHLTRKRPGDVDQAMVLPYPKQPVDRTVQIAGFSWTLPPDPGEDGPYPSLTFLIGAAMSSSASGIMTLSEIIKWISERYPSRRPSANRAINSVLGRKADFASVRASIRSRSGAWKLHNPAQFRSYYENNIYLKHRRGVAHRDWALRNPLPTPERGSPGAIFPPSGALPSGQPVPPGTGSETQIAPALSVEIGGYILTLPPHREGQKKPPLRLLCGCAIALGSQGSSTDEVVEWIARRYFVRGAKAVSTLRTAVRAELRACNTGFRRTENPASRKCSKRGATGMKWEIKNPANFAASYGGVISSAVATLARSSTPVAGEHRPVDNSGVMP